MKRVSLEKFADETVTVAECLIGVLTNTPGQTGAGLTTGEMRTRFKIMDKIEAAKGADLVDLEDSEFAVVKECFSRAQFAGPNRFAVAVEDRLSNAPDAPKPVAEK